MWSWSSNAAKAALTPKLLMSYGPVTRLMRSTTGSLPAAMPTRNPAMPAVLDSERNTTRLR